MALIYVILPMMTDLLIDTNILIYAYDRESAFHDSSRTLIENPDFNLFVTTKNISEFFAVCSKLKIPLSSTFNFYSEIKSNSFVLFPTNNSLIIFEELIQKYMPKRNRVYDVEIVSLMLDNGIYFIATHNKKDFIQNEAFFGNTDLNCLRTS